ncbi:patatin-like phospholipase family protein [Chitinophaga sp. RAB17]|uniref:patatin-like phospholipase family protein n=1 Tax=Chitinophaga sp. RAB17 TaxID=3233049 RepID=UPI003F8D9321
MKENLSNLNKHINVSFDKILVDLVKIEEQQDKERHKIATQKSASVNVGSSKFTIVQKLEALKSQRKQFSDIVTKVDEEQELQWVHLVQEGGGTLGISLVGFVFVLEYLGIRFLRLAGTSAGAINTMFLAAIGNKEDPKTPELYDMMIDEKRFNMKRFVDAKNPVVRWLIFSLGKGMGLLSNLSVSFLALLIMILLPLPLISFLGREGRVVYLLALLLFIVAATFIFILFFRLSKYNFGINPGVRFKEFVKNELAEYGVNSTEDLYRKAKGDGTFKLDSSGEYRAFLYSDDPISGSKSITVSLRRGGGESDMTTNTLSVDYNKIKYDISLVATDIANKCKIILPKDAYLYFEGVKDINPAEFVRASMAIPIFFEPQFFPDKPVNGNPGTVIDKVLKKRWWPVKGMGADQVEDKGILIDGGSLSNFPINLFHEAKIKWPRLPVIGVRIMDAKPSPDYVVTKRMSLGYFLGSIINTLRGNEDNAFIAANPFYKKFCIAEIKAYQTKVNWLNFDLTSEQKNALFMKGVEAALKYLENFDWDSYKAERAKL